MGEVLKLKRCSPSAISLVAWSLLAVGRNRSAGRACGLAQASLLGRVKLAAEESANAWEVSCGLLLMGFVLVCTSWLLVVAFLLVAISMGLLRG